jgi:alkylation response protein AidB-like acyl-CoA dehydrogenase
MRAFGSNSISFEDVRLPLSALRGGFPAGDAVEYMERNLTAGLFHAAVALGIAEDSHALAADGLHDRDLDPRTQVLTAEAFMHPLGANRAYAFLGEIAVGREPSLH